MNRGDFKPIHDQLIQLPVDSIDDPLIDAACNALLWASDEVQRLEAELAAMTKDRDHWKNNHATEVRRARVLKERTDMPIERVAAYEQWGKDKAELAALKAQGNAELAGIRNIVRDDAHAITFQSLAQYRTALLKAIDAAIAKAEGGK